MKLQLVLFAIFINYVICKEKYAVNGFPKKVKPYGNGKILINSGKYVYKTKVPQTTTETTKRAYTVFQIVGNSKTVQNVPDSPYFPVDQSYDHKPRVKKVLPDYAWSPVRSKRSASVDTPADEKKVEATSEKIIDLKEEKKVEVTPNLQTVNQDENLKVEKKSAPSFNKSIEVTTKKKEETKSTKKEDSKSLERLGDKQTNTKRNGESNTAKKAGPKSDKNSQSKVQMRTVKTGNHSATKTKGKEIHPAVTNVKSKKNGTNSRVQHRVGKKQKNKKQKQRKAHPDRPGKHAGKGNKSPHKGKNQARSKKAQKTKPTNGTRTGKNIKAERRLIAGREALIEDYPYVVSIQKNKQHWCSGALLNPRLVITTANCLWKSTRDSRMEVRAGSRHVDHGGQLAGIQEVLKHPGWGLRRTPDNDVAFILLDRNIRFSDSVHGVDLPNRVMMPPFDDAWVTSWGSERRDGVYDSDTTALQVYHTRLMSHEKCNNVTMRFSVVVTENFICLAQSGQTAPCTRDTGAPAVSDGILWGLASWGIRKLCGTERFPAVFSYLASHSNIDFISNATRYLMSDNRFYPLNDRMPL